MKRNTKIIGIISYLLLGVLIYFTCTGCGPTYRESLTGKEWIQWRQAQDNYDQDKWAREYRRLNRSRSEKKPSVTIDKPNLAVPSPIRP